MNKSQEGPYAFPQTEFGDLSHSDYNGMMLRDYFAAKALPSILKLEGAQESDDNPHEYAKCVAHLSYLIADAMLEERRSKPHD